MLWESYDTVLGHARDTGLHLFYLAALHSNKRVFAMQEGSGLVYFWVSALSSSEWASRYSTRDFQVLAYCVLPKC